MALSDWDTYALLIEVDGDSPLTIAPCNGIVEGIDGNSTLSIHKDHLSLSIKNLSSDSEDSIYIENGNIGTYEFMISSRCDRKSTLYVLASSCDYSSRKCKYMVGIGCYGYRSGVVARIFRWLSDVPMKISLGRINWWMFSYFNELYNKCDPKYVGTTKKMIRKLRRFVLKEMDYDDRWKDIDFFHGLRFNQGDAYFAHHLDTDIPATRVDNQEEPLIFAGLKNITNKSESNND